MDDRDSGTPVGTHIRKTTPLEYYVFPIHNHLRLPM